MLNFGDVEILGAGSAKFLVPTFFSLVYMIEIIAFSSYSERGQFYENFRDTGGTFQLILNVTEGKIRRRDITTEWILLSITPTFL